MRKQDYETLARAIRKNLQYAKSMQTSALTHDRKTYADGAAATLESLARYLAEHLHVDKAAFLTACGLK